MVGYKAPSLWRQTELGLNPDLASWLALGSWTNYYVSLNPKFIMCKIGVLMPISQCAMRKN